MRAARWAPPALLGAAWLAAVYGPLLSPARAMANRDVPNFHLPLRSAFRGLAAFAVPAWNPWLHGGQPVLSNPSYGAFYPPSWLVFAAPPAYALSLMTVLHAGIAFAGAWRLARRLGCGRGAAALAALGFAGSGVYLSLLSALNLYWGLSWLPWVLAFGDEALRAGETASESDPWERRRPAGPSSSASSSWLRPALLCGGALGLALLNGEPATVVVASLALLALAASAGARRPRAAARVLVPFAFAVLLAAVQLVPTLARIADSPRSALPAAQATVWSMRPARLAEVVFPHVYGDPTRELEGGYFGARLNDQGHPYLESLYPGLLLAVLGAAALLRGGVPRRAAWAAAVAGGVFLALGRYNPLYEGVRRALPVLAVLRFPEKFMMLAVPALALAGALGWQRLLDEREAGRPRAATLPLVLAGLLLAAAAVLAAMLRAVPASDPARAAVLVHLRAESGSAVATAAAVAALLALCRWRRLPSRLLSALAVAVLAIDLWHYGHRLLRTVPAELYRTPPPLAAALLPSGDRIYLAAGMLEVAGRVPRDGTDWPGMTRAAVERLAPWSGLIWRVPYAFDVDYDLMLTGWARKSEAVLEAERSDPERLGRYLGAWNVGTTLAERTGPEAPAGPGVALEVVRREANPWVLPRFRFVPRAVLHPTWDEALAAARAGGWRAGQEEHAARSSRPGRQTAGSLAFARPPRLLASADEGANVRLDYAAPDGAFLVAASTFDEGWHARVDGAAVPVYVTAACQLGVRLPAGSHRLELRYRDPWVHVGLSVSLAALAGAALLWWRFR